MRASRSASLKDRSLAFGVRTGSVIQNAAIIGQKKV
jgi:hypothetical protein